MVRGRVLLLIDRGLLDHSLIRPHSITCPPRSGHKQAVPAAVRLRESDRLRRSAVSAKGVVDGIRNCPLSNDRGPNWGKMPNIKIGAEVHQRL